MLSQARGEILLDDVIAAGVLEEAHRLPRQRLGDTWGEGYKLVAGLEGAWQIGATRVRVGVGLSHNFPAKLPHVFLLSRDESKFIPHIEEDGHVCCFEAEGLVLDLRRPASILRETLEKARRTIEAGLSRSNRRELFEECEAYWSSSTRILCNVAPDDVLRYVTVFSGACSGVADNRCAFDEVSYRIRGTGLTEQKGTYVPLETTIFDEPNFHPRKVDSIQALRAIIRKHISSENRKRLRHAARARGDRAFVLLGIPKPGGDRALLGLWLRNIESRQPLLDDTASGKVERVRLERSDPDVLRGRVASAPSVKDAHVILIGCGSVGGHVATSLAWAGVGKLTLVDDDEFQPANTFRHTLGRGGVLTKSKVAALKQELELKVPGINVNAVKSTIEFALDRGTVKLDSSSLLLVTIGNPTACLALNSRFIEHPGAPPVIFTWIEPYGVGGHAVLTNTRDAGASGCFECLFRDDPEFGLINTADFAAPGQLFGKQNLGCSGAFIPYGDLDARETATMAARLALDTLRRRQRGHVLRSWKGDATDFREAGFQTSSRYDLDEQVLRERGKSFGRQGCRCCRGGST
ncbi:MAG: ThiF family adenylyltransferase [Polyangiaceae bacterium]|nr:ThiF family adenylyltransferase [Polyangiaceae bacterium]